MQRGQFSLLEKKFSFDFASSDDIVQPYSPMLFAKERQTEASSRRSSTKYLIAHASSSTLPELNPRYAESKIGKNPFSLTKAAISFHWPLDGSHPVGLWAHV